MKKILITGANSYIGTSLEKWLMQNPENYQVDTVDMIGDSWRDMDFSLYDAVVHVAGIVHQKEKKENAALYYKINCNLAGEVAQKAKTDGIRQFILLSTMSVFGVASGVVDNCTIPQPVNNYGRSKLQAEGLVMSYQDESFRVAVIRPPMVYGRGSKGNYSTLSLFARRLPAFPDIKNERSMIYIENLCLFLQTIIDKCSSGIFHPQNSKYICTSDMVRLIAKSHGHHLYMTRMLNPLIKLLRLGVVTKIFGSLTYSWSLSADAAIDRFDLETSVRLTER